MQITANCCQEELFPFMKALNVCASWPFALVFAVCSSASFWPRHGRQEATSQSVFVGDGLVVTLCASRPSDLYFNACK